MSFFYIRPDELWTLDGAVAGSVATDHEAGWLVDGKPGRPVQGLAGGALSLTVTNPAGEVGMVAALNHNVDVGVNIAVSGGVTATLVVASLGKYGIPTNPWLSVTPVLNVSSLTVAVTGNSKAVIVGEFVAGKKRTLTSEPLAGARWTPVENPIVPPSRTGALSVLDRGQLGLDVEFDLILTAAELTEVQDWREAQRGTSKPSVIAMFSDVNDAMIGRLVDFTYRRQEGLFFATLKFEEYQRTRW